ncbi:DICT sensory domain-containing protein [Halobacteriaceae archaeon GCM10025711]
MTLHDVIESVEDRAKRLTLYVGPGGEAFVDSVREFFDSQNVTVDHRPADGGPERAVLREDGEDLVTVEFAALETLVDPDVRPPDVGADVSYRRLLAHLDDTTFTSYDRRQMLYTSREVEDRAWRLRDGELHAGFQELAIFETQRDVYRRLGQSGLDVHVYGVPDGVTDEETNVTVHPRTEADFGRTWFVVFDGGGDDAQKSALLAEERSSDHYYGFWTYDADVVDRIIAVLDA